MTSLRHRLTALAEVYARHAERHGPNRLLPAEVLPAHGRMPGHAEPSSRDSDPDGCTVEHSALQGCTRTRIDAMEEHSMAHGARHGSSDDGHGAVDRDRLRREMHRPETSLHYWPSRWHHTPGPSDPGTPRHRIQQVIDLLRQELGLKQSLESS